MFLTDQNNLVETLKALRLQQCAYSMEHQATRCDCKYRYSDKPITWKSENGNGCPELHVAIRGIGLMNEKQFETFLNRIRKEDRSAVKEMEKQWKRRPLSSEVADHQNL